MLAMSEAVTERKNGSHDTETVRKGTTAGRIRNNWQIKSVSCRHNGKPIEITFQPNVQITKKKQDLLNHSEGNKLAKSATFLQKQIPEKQKNKNGIKEAEQQGKRKLQRKESQRRGVRLMQDTAACLMFCMALKLFSASSKL